MRNELAIWLAIGLGCTGAKADSVNEDGPYKLRTFAYDTNIYDVKLPLGRFYIVDKANNTIGGSIEKPKFNCGPKETMATLIMPDMKPSQAYYFVADNKYSGGLSIFTASASLSNEERHEVILTDISRARVAAQCELGNRAVYDIAKTLKGAQGKTVLWVYGTVMSNLTKEVFSQKDVSGGFSAGSWLKIGAESYQGSTKLDSVPVVSVQGLAVDVPLPGLKAGGVGNARRIESLSDLGLKPQGLKFNAPATQ